MDEINFGAKEELTGSVRNVGRRIRLCVVERLRDTLTIRESPATKLDALQRMRILEGDVGHADWSEVLSKVHRRFELKLSSSSQRKTSRMAMSFWGGMKRGCMVTFDFVLKVNKNLGDGMQSVSFQLAVDLPENDAHPVAISDFQLADGRLDVLVVGKGEGPKE